MLLGTEIFILILTVIWMLLLKRLVDHTETALFIQGSLVPSVSAFIHVDYIFAIHPVNTVGKFLLSLR